MKSTRGGLVTALAAGALLVLPMSNTRVMRVVSRVGTQSSDPKLLYNAHEKEYWLSTDEFDYVRPGFMITVNSITLNANLQPVVDVSYTDGLGVPLDRAGVLTPGAVSMSFVLAWRDPNARDYTAYTFRSVTSSITGMTATQAAADSGGTFQDIDIGHSIYTFKTKLPAGYDATATTTLGIYATRDTTAVLGKPYYANVEQDFVPNGAPVTQTWDILSNAACNTCHNPLSAHGGSRQDVKLCVLCHQPQTTDPDTGNTVDFKVMIHKIHMGSSLPSVQAGTPYQIIGFQNSVNDFSTVVFPQDIRNCTTCHAGPTPPTAVGQLVRLPEHGGLRLLPRRRDLHAGRNPPGRTPGQRQPLFDVPHTHEWLRMGRVGHGRPHGSLQVDAAEGHQRDDRLGEQYGTGPEPDHLVHARPERRHADQPGGLRQQPQRPDGRPDDRLRDQPVP